MRQYYLAGHSQHFILLLLVIMQYQKQQVHIIIIFFFLKQYKKKCVRVVFYMYIDAQQIFRDIVVQHSGANRIQKTIRISHRATDRIFGASRLVLLHEKDNAHQLLVRRPSRRLPFVLFYYHLRSLTGRHSNLLSLLLPRLIDC